MNNLRDDHCAQQERSESNANKLKYLTHSFSDLLDAQNNLNYFGMTIKDRMFVPETLLDKDSELRMSQMTNCNIKTNLGPLPVNVGYRGQLHHGDTTIEMNIKGLWDRELKSCQPKGTDFHKRHFQIFPEGIETPDALKSVENWNRAGASTRFLQLQRNKYFM